MEEILRSQLLKVLNNSAFNDVNILPNELSKKTGEDLLAVNVFDVYCVLNSSRVFIGQKCSQIIKKSFY